MMKEGRHRELLPVWWSYSLAPQGLGAFWSSFGEGQAMTKQRGEKYFSGNAISRRGTLYLCLFRKLLYDDTHNENMIEKVSSV